MCVLCVCVVCVCIQVCWGCMGTASGSANKIVARGECIAKDNTSVFVMCVCVCVCVYMYVLIVWPSSWMGGWFAGCLARWFITAYGSLAV